MEGVLSYSNVLQKGRGIDLNLFKFSSYNKQLAFVQRFSFQLLIADFGGGQLLAGVMSHTL